MRGSLKIDPLLRHKKGETTKAQATRIFNELKGRLASDPTKKIGLIYSANNRQANALHQSIAQNGPIAPISGDGQAALYELLIPMINEDPSLKDKVKVLPIATSASGGNNIQGNTVTTAQLDRDLKQIQDHIDNGYEVISGPGIGGFAVGHGASRHFYKTDIVNMNGQSQGDYIQNSLRDMAAGRTLDFSNAEPIPAPATHNQTQPVASYLAKSNPDLRDVVDAYRKKFHKEPVLEKGGLSLSFDDQKSAVDFFKEQANERKAFDMRCSDPDHRVYSDGMGNFVQGTNKEVEAYKANPEQFKIGKDGTLSNNPSDSAAASNESPPPFSPMVDGLDGDEPAPPTLGSGSSMA